MRIRVVFLLLMTLFLFGGCIDLDNDDDLGTAAADADYSGTYTGSIDASGGRVTRLVIFQTGNSIEATDNNGSRYKGRVSGNKTVLEGTDGAGNSIKIEGTFSGETTLNGIWSESTGRNVNFSLTKL